MMSTAWSRGQNLAGDWANCLQSLVRALKMLRTRTRMALENVSSFQYLMQKKILEKYKSGPEKN